MSARLILLILAGVTAIAGSVLGLGFALGMSDPTLLRPVAGLLCIGFVMGVVQVSSRA